MNVNKPENVFSLCSRITIRILRRLGLCSIFLGYGFLFAQDSYKRIAASGPIPKDFLYSSQEKYDQQLDQIQERKGRVRNAKKQFYEGSFYYINELLLSGKVLFNDPVSTYLNKVADVLLEGEPELRSNIHIYAVKSPSVNAFTSIDGKIFVNLGLLAHVENEAQLAYILTHEISHFTQQHALGIFLHNKGLSQNPNGALKKANLSTLILENNLYSQEKEQEADLEGLSLFMKSSYNAREAVKVFDILKNAEMPFADIDFDREFLEKKTLSFPDSYYLDPDSLSLTSDSSETDALFFSSHPSPEKRQKIILEKLAKNREDQGKMWIVSKETFYESQKIARFESCFLFLQQQKYERAIYCAYSLLKEYPDHPFLEKIVVKALYGLAKYASVGRLWDVHVDHEEVKGKSKQFHHIINKMPDQELCILASLHTWELRNKYPQDEELVLMSKDLMQDLGQFFVDSISWFQISDDGLIPPENNYIRYAFSDLMKERRFRKELGENLRIGKARNTRGVTRKKPENERKSELEGFKLDIDKVIFVNPSFQQIDERKERTIRFLSSEQAELKYIRLIRKHADKLGLKYQLLSKHMLTPEDVELFSDLSLLNEWVEEKTRYEQLALISINHNPIQKLKEKYGTSHFIWTGGISVAQKRRDKAIILLVGLFIPVMPYSLYYNFSPQHNTFFYTLIYDIEKGEPLLRYPKWIKMKDEFDVLNSNSYDLIFQLSKPRKK